jgi:hypothetical protein
LPERRLTAMARFFIEVPHEEDRTACIRAIEIFLRTGSHFLTHADWGCKDGEHKAWIIVDVDNKDDARMIVPNPYRADAKIVKLNLFTMKEVEDLKRYHDA